jgi:hypothetical protein
MLDMMVGKKFLETNTTFQSFQSPKDLEGQVDYLFYVVAFRLYMNGYFEVW